MKKLFFAICFIYSFCLVNTIHAAVTTLDEAAEQASTPKPRTDDVSGLPDPENIDAVRAFFKERFQTAPTSSASELGDLNKSSAMDIQHSIEYIQDLAESKKSALEKIYDEALERIDAPAPEFSPDTVFYEQVKNTAQAQNNAALFENMALVNVRLPNGRVILAPAQEHIAYLLSSFQILPTGTIEVEEDVIVVANGEKLKNGLVKAMPKFTRSRTGVKKKVDINLLSVTINGRDVPYKLKEIGNQIIFSPKENYVLEPGVYTYHFRYLLDRRLWYYDDFTEFYTDLTGTYGLVIASANAVISVPDGKTFMSETALAGYPDTLSADRTVIARLSENALGFASVVALDAYEGMHLLVSLDKSVFIEPGLSRRFAWFVTDEGDILFALLGFLAIFGSYYLSLRYLRSGKSRFNTRTKQMAALNRYIMTQKFDTRSFVSALLELIRTRTIDMRQENNALMLIKQTDKTKNLPVGLKKILKSLFGKNDTAIEVSHKNLLKFKRAYHAYELYIRRMYKMMTLKFNFGYLMFGIAMSLLSIYAVSYIAVNPLETALILIFSMLLMAFYIFILLYPYRSKIKKYIFRSIAAGFVVFNILLLSVYIHFVAACLMAGMVYAIMAYTQIFANQNGLIKTKISNIEALQNYLKENAAQVASSIEFEARQAYIFAFEIEDLYAKNSRNQSVYRLDLAKKMLGVL